MYLIINQVIKIVDSSKIFRNLRPGLQNFGQFRIYSKIVLELEIKINKKAYARIC